MKVLLCGGGTAGHVMPAIAIGEIIEKAFPGSEIRYVGRSNGDENKAYEKTGKKLYTIDICGIRRSLDTTNIKLVFKLIKSSRIAKRIISEFDPDLIIGTGGYVSFPFVYIGRRMRIKTMLHESNAYPGLVTRVFGPRCDKVLLNLEEAKKHLRKTKNCVTVGNPMRNAFSETTRETARRAYGLKSGDMLIVSFGGSLGSEALNNVIPEFMLNFVASQKQVTHIHATGRKSFEELKRKYPNLCTNHENARLIPYIEDMPTLLKAADIAITRSGAMTLSELIDCATPSILIPSPNVTANHQYENAKHLHKAGAAEIIEEKDLTTANLENTVRKLLSNPKQLRKMSEKAKSLQINDTESKIIKVISDIL